MKINILKNHLKKGFLIVKLRFAFLPTAFIVYRILVHYRVGSLESSETDLSHLALVHYRVGSLEIDINTVEQHTSVHCRIGS